MQKTELWNLRNQSATVELAAYAVGVIQQELRKLSHLKKKMDGILVVTAGDQKIDNSKFKKVFGMKAKMLTADE